MRRSNTSKSWLVAGTYKVSAGLTTMSSKKPISKRKRLGNFSKSKDSKKRKSKRQFSSRSLRTSQIATSAT